MKLRKRRSTTTRMNTMKMMRSSREVMKRMTTMKKRRSPAKSPRRRENDTEETSFLHFYLSSQKTFLKKPSKIRGKQDDDGERIPACFPLYNRLLNLKYVRGRGRVEHLGSDPGASFESEGDFSRRLGYRAHPRKPDCRLLTMQIILDPVEKEFEAENRKMLEVYHRSKEQRYAFDRIYRNETSEEIYQQTVKPLIRTVLSGRNATVFAYGPTGTGKTFTMLGNQDCYGLKYLSFNSVY